MPPAPVMVKAFEVVAFAPFVSAPPSKTFVTLELTELNTLPDADVMLGIELVNGVGSSLEGKV